MNRKGFTLVELLGVIVILSLVVGIAIPTSLKVINNTKAKSEKAFVETLRDAMDVYLSGDDKKKPELKYDHFEGVYEYSDDLSFEMVMNSTFKPIDLTSFKNPVNGLTCNDTDKIIKIYRDTENHVYFYEFKANDLGNCIEMLVNKDCLITNVPGRADDVKCKW